MNNDSSDFTAFEGDRQLAEVLARLLDGQPSTGLPAEPVDEAELRQLAVLGMLLETQAGTAAQPATVQQPLDPAFAARLRTLLLSEHHALRAGSPSPVTAAPVAVPRTRAASEAGPSQPPTAQIGWRARLGWWPVLRHRIGLSAAIVFALALALFLAVQSALRQPVLHVAGELPTSQPTAQRRAGPAHSATAAAATPRLFAQPRAGSPSTPPRGTPSPPAVRAPIAVPRFAPAATPVHTILPAALPVFPARLPIFTAHARVMSATQLSAILATFPGMVPIARAGGETYHHGTAALQVVPSVGSVRYTDQVAPTSQSAHAIDGALAVLSAQKWLVQHRLYPSGIDASATTIVSGTQTFQVTFVPTLPSVPAGAHILLDRTAAVTWLTVVLDTSGHVLSATMRWPRLTVHGTVPLLGIAAAVHAASPSVLSASTPSTGPAAPLAIFTVHTVRLVYTPVAAAQGFVTVQPAYVLDGTLRGTGGPAQHQSVVVPASRG